jgi:hypothetical protein
MLRGWQLEVSSGSHGAKNESSTPDFMTVYHIRKATGRQFLSYLRYNFYTLGLRVVEEQDLVNH